MEKKDFDIFKAAIDSIELKNVNIIECTYKQFDEPEISEHEIKVKFSIDDDKIYITEKILKIPYESEIIISSDPDGSLFESRFKHLLVFEIKNKDSITKLLETKLAYDFFKNAQIRKLIFPYIRSFFHQILSTTSLPPFDIPLLR